MMMTMAMIMMMIKTNKISSKIDHNEVKEKRISFSFSCSCSLFSVSSKFQGLGSK
jgi:hypothetical protein